MQNTTAEQSEPRRPRTLSYEELQAHLAHGRALRSEMAFNGLCALGRGIAGFFTGLRHRETTRWKGFSHSH